MTRRFVLAVGLLCAIPVQLLSAQEMVGYVADLDGEGALLLRGDMIGRRLLLGANVLAGDTVVAPPRTRVRIDTVAGPVDPCVPAPTSGDCRRRFPAAGQARAPAEIAARLAAMVTWFAAPTRNFVTRSDDPPTIRFGAGVPQAVLVGKRPLWLAWSNGTPPFKVTVEAAGSLVAQAEATGREVLLPMVVLAPGVVTVSVLDGIGRKAILALVATGSGPSRPKLATKAVGPDHGSILEAAELAAVDGGRWTFEAVQSLTGVASRVPVADLTRRALAAGYSL